MGQISCRSYKYKFFQYVSRVLGLILVEMVFYYQISDLRVADGLFQSGFVFFWVYFKKKFIGLFFTLSYISD